MPSFGSTYGHSSPGVHFRRPIGGLRSLLVAAALILSAAPASARTVQIVALGDSLTAGLGLPAGESFADVLQKALRAKGYDVDVANAGVSGDTAADGLARLDWATPEGTDAAIVELGANDMLRGLDPAAAKTSLGEILARLQARHVPTLIAGMRAAPISARTINGASMRSIPTSPRNTARRSIRSFSTASPPIPNSIRKTASIRQKRGSK
jgi:lysophospholipase L1-like esterase